MNDRGYVISVIEEMTDVKVRTVFETVPQKKRPPKKLINRIRQAFPESRYSVRLAWTCPYYEYCEL